MTIFSFLPTLPDAGRRASPSRLAGSSRIVHGQCCAVFSKPRFPRRIYNDPVVSLLGLTATAEVRSIARCPTRMRLTRVVMVLLDSGANRGGMTVRPRRFD